MTKRSDLILGWSMLIISIFYIWQALQLPSGESFLNSSQSFPILIGISLTIFSITLIVKAFFKKSEGKKEKTDVHKIGFKRALFYILWTGLYIFLFIPFLGFTVSTIGYMIIMILFYKEVKWFTSVFVAVGTMIFVYYVFNQLLYINFP
ncbi:tripartite tricarboxylate transporter TctB family protein [Virgibacillus sp. W0181]|uniref:tripartite tricarboxylate transporter TctB family protein n=1 Tax=Virgibacillus sp. W0181 TaxID=3391581 RepID=UPI003F4592B1